MGRIKLVSVSKATKVFLNGAFAGVAEDLKDMWLEPAAYNLKLESPSVGSSEFRVYVLSGKTVKINFDKREDKGR